MVGAVADEDLPLKEGKQKEVDQPGSVLDPFHVEEEVSVPFLVVVSFPFHHLDVQSTVVGVVQ